MITITALGRSGTQAASTSSSSSTPRAYAYLVRVDQSYLLLDCGAPEDLSFPPSPSSATTLDDVTLPNGDLDTARIASLPLDDALQLIAPRLSSVLLSHSSLEHLGLYAYAHARLGLKCPAYATLPSSAMGRLVTLEASLAIAADCDVAKLDKRPAQSTSSKRRAAVKVEDQVASSDRNRCIPSREETDEAFDGIRTLRYLQPTVLEGE